MIVIRGVTIAGKLTDIDLAVKPGELVAVVGSRGSGKTTLMRALLGQHPLDRGTVTLGGCPAGTAECLARVGAAGEAWGLLDRLTVWENLRTFVRLWGVPESRAAQLLHRLDLGGRRGVRADRLTPGEAARLRLARALLHDPLVLLLDEPAGDIDSESAAQIAFTIAEEAEAGKAVLVTTFGDPRILQAASRVCYLEGTLLMEPAVRLAAAGGGRTAAGPQAGAAPAGAAPAEVAPAGAAPAGAAVGARPESQPALPPRPVPHVAARKGDRVLLFRPEEIRYAYARDKAVYLETGEGPCGVSFTLSELEERLAESGFFRSHKAYLVNLSYVKEIAAWTRDSYSLILKDGEEVPLSKHRAHELRVRLNW